MTEHSPQPPQQPYDPWRPLGAQHEQSYPTLVTEQPPLWHSPGDLPGEPGGPGAGGPGGPGGPRRWVRGTAAAGVLALVALGSGTAGAVIATRIDQPSSTASTSSLQSSLGSSSSSSSSSSSAGAPTQSLAKVAAAVQPSVVSITVQTAQGGGEGSGVVLSSDGVVLTNNHVVAEATDGSITVKFTDGRSVKGTVVGTDPSDDLAVVRAQGITDATPATLGSSSSLHVGDTVLAIGSPLGLEGSVTSGIVSALHRILDEGDGGARIADAIQTDAAINPGNSGGALLDASGKVVGINTAIASLGNNGTSQSGSIGVGFAIPIDTAKQVVSDILAGRTPSHAQLGVQVSDAQGGGALISAVTSGSAADKAGLEAGDIVTQVGDTKVTDGDSLASAIRSHKVGDKVTVQYTRGGKAQSVTVTLGSASS